MVEAGRPTPAQNPSGAAARKGKDDGDSVEIQWRLTSDNQSQRISMNLNESPNLSPSRRGRARDPLPTTER